MASRPQTSPASTSPQTSPAFTKPLSPANDPAGQYESNRPLEEGTLPEIETLTLPSYYKQRYTVDGASSRVLEKSFGRSNNQAFRNACRNPRPPGNGYGNAQEG